MRYVLLVCDQENAELSESEQQERSAACTAFQAEMEARGVLLGRERPRPASSSTTVRVRDAGLVAGAAASAGGPPRPGTGADSSRHP